MNIKNPDAPCSEAQVSYIRGLLEKKDLTNFDPTKKEWLANPNNHARLTKGQASNAIQELLALDDKVKATPAPTASTGQPVTPATTVEDKFEAVKAARYFVTYEGEELFVKVDKPTDGRWAGYTFMHSQASDDFYPIKDKARREGILQAIIEQDPLACMNEYGIRLGVCGNCGRTLTNRDSRLRGLGPICAERILGAPTDEERQVLEQLGLL